MKSYLGNTEGEITSANTSIHSTLIYAVGQAIQQEDDEDVKNDLETVEQLLVTAHEEVIIVPDNWEKM